MLADLSSPLWGVKFTLEAYPRMPVAGWIMLGLGALLLLQIFIIRGMKISGFFTSLALLAYWPAAYALHWYLFNYANDSEAGRSYSPIEAVLVNKDTLADCDRILLVTCGVLAGLFFLCLLESVINYHRKPREQGKERREVVEDNPFVASPPPAPAAAPAAPRPAVPRKPGTKPAARPAPRPSAEDNPFNFT
jgi:hypothetical protein